MDAYGKRNRRKQAKGQGCALLLVAGATVMAALTEAARWIA